MNLYAFIANASPNEIDYDGLASCCTCSSPPTVAPAAAGLPVCDITNLGAVRAARLTLDCDPAISVTGVRGFLNAAACFYLSCTADVRYQCTATFLLPAAAAGGIGASSGFGVASFSTTKTTDPHSSLFSPSASASPSSIFPPPSGSSGSGLLGSGFGAPAIPLTPAPTFDWEYLSHKIVKDCLL